MNVLTSWMPTLALATQLSGSPAASGPTAAASDSLEAACVRFAEVAEGALRQPREYPVLWEAARTGATLGAALGDSDAGRGVLRTSVLLARAAVEADPEGVEGHYWRAASAGLLADVEGGRTRIAYAEEAWRASSRALELDSLHAGAHHVQGRLHAAVMRLNWVTRTLAGRLLGAALLREASWEEAERHLSLAAELAPGEAIHHLELGILYRDRGRADEARRALRAAMDAPECHAADRTYRERAARLLAVAE